MIKIKALNDVIESDDSSDSELQKITREAEEESLNARYLHALETASKGDVADAIKQLEALKADLDVECPKVKNVALLKRLRYVTYKNLGLLSNDLNFIFDALEVDDSDFNLWITAGILFSDLI